MKYLPVHLTFQQAKEAVEEAIAAYPQCRAGQAVCNYYSNIGPELDAKLYEENNKSRVIYILHAFR